ncbi:MAG: aspartate aminotransferase [Crocinitomicaceae bacterium]|nr:aspartate aminotransferase [Crocinitomicaceae bacterium]|tara:strand:- start:2469 stop:3665 length:1197 start_codon:yes stop_codon:yes gene_type:complete
MMNNLSDRISNLAESQTIAMAQKSREMKEKGIDVISLSLGEPDFDTPDFIKEAAKKAIDDNYTHYPPVPGYLELRKAIAQKLKRDNNLEYGPENIVVSTGAKQSLMNVVLSMVNPGDEVILPAPYWVSYKAMVELAEGVPVVIPTSVDADFKISADDLKKYIKRKTKLIIFSSPCNPSGSVYSKEELKQIADVIKAKDDLFVISDEIYELINFSGQHESLAQFEAIKDQVITVNGVSKGFSMTGWRIGYIAAPEWIAKACTKIQGQFTSGASTIAQMAAKAAVEADPSVVVPMKEKFKERRDLMLSLLYEIPNFQTHVPEGAFYLFPNVSRYFGKAYGEYEIENDTDLCFYLLQEANVAVVPGSAFGSPECLRISYATSEDILREAMNRIKTALDKLA